MKRFHVHVAVENLETSIRFYSRMFGTEPAVRKPDYAKWMMEDPRMNFAISQRGAKPGIDHLGFQVDTEEELTTLRQQVAAAGLEARDQPEATCCYARSDKYWMTDPQGIAWETYRTLGEAQIYGADSRQAGDAGACCTPRPQAVHIVPAEANAEKCC
ncbi:MAG: ArsI/CadI family heavy metal resistance metalloenzyme [Betaproteobacteria bacterium]